MIGTVFATARVMNFEQPILAVLLVLWVILTSHARRSSDLFDRIWTSRLLCRFIGFTVGHFSSMPYILKCTCGTKISVQRSQAGSRIDCPQCRETLEIPTIRGLAELDVEAETAAASDIRKSSHRPRWTPLRGAIAALCFVVALVGLGRSGLYGVYRLTNPTTFSGEDMLREAEQLAGEYTPVETWDTWRYLQEAGLGSKKPPRALLEKRFLEQQDIRILRWAAAGGMGLFGLLISSFWRSPRTSR